jgi:transposase
MGIQPIFRCAVGMDVHLAVIYVCVILQQAGCEPEVHRRQFGAFQRDRRAMAEWIAGFAPDTVVMESTGIYWKSPYAASAASRSRCRASRSWLRSIAWSFLNSCTIHRTTR